LLGRGKSRQHGHNTSRQPRSTKERARLLWSDIALSHLAELTEKLNSRHSLRRSRQQRYYERKRAEGKKHNQAIRALGRHLCRVIFKMLSQERTYRIDP
jgi:hypothetical protein